LVGDGEFVALLGPSGCGKSTLVRIVAGLEDPDRGEVELGEHTVFGPKVRVPPEERRLGMVFQSYAVWPHKTVLENVAYPLVVRRTVKSEAEAEARRALDLVRLSPLASRHPHELSGGQQQRVALARALVGKPTVLLLDEPLSNLDARLREELRAEISDLRRRLGFTVIFVTHDQAEALATADRVAVMRHGRIVQAGTPEEIYAAPTDLYVAETLGAINALPVRTVSVLDGQMRVESESGLVVSLPANDLARDPPEQLVLAVRPDDVRAAPDGVNTKVTARAFLGSRIELRLTLDGGTEIRAVLPAATPIGDTLRIGLSHPKLLRK
jgi:ABC-type Fe3+/spermidine/putrescine transport system ATPase subunit